MSFYYDVSMALKVILESEVEGIGSVYPTNRYVYFPEDYIQLFTEIEARETSGRRRRVNTWIIHRDSISQTTDMIPLQQTRRSHRFVIEGYCSMQDNLGTENEFQELIEAVLDAITAHKTLTLSNVELAEVPQLESVDISMFGPVPCHHCVISVIVHERKIVGFKP